MQDLNLKHVARSRNNLLVLEKKLPLNADKLAARTKKSMKILNQFLTIMGTFNK